ncbi:MAG: AzlC family ABC transporter permease [Variibacter sp.]|nr:AzlC family ABC transporter permease [Variibacter sp.]
MRGARAALTSVFVLVTFGTFLGIGALAHDLRFSVGWAVTGAVLIWAAPAHVITITALASGAGLIEIAVAVGLSGVRLLPMAVSLLPLLRMPRKRPWYLVLPAHFMTVTVWSEGLRLVPALARADRAPFISGMGTGFTLVAAVSTAAGFYLAAGLPPVLGAALLFLTPLSFLMSTAGNARTLADRLALVAGLVLGPLLASQQVGLDLLWTGLIGGTLAYGAQRLSRAVRST